MKRLRPALVVFGAALVLRLLYVASVHDAFFFDHLQTEPAHYDAWASAIVDGRAPVHLPFDEAPGYPYFVALLYAVFGRGPLAVAIVQAVLGAAACAAIAAVARRLGGPVAGGRAGWIAGGIACAYAPLLYFTGQLEPAALGACAVAFALVATPFSDANSKRWVIAGAAWAAAIVVRSELVLAAPIVALHAWQHSGRRAALRAGIAPALLLASSLAANAIASGHPVVLTTGSGVNLWLGNNPLADGVNPFVHGALDAVAADVEAGAGPRPDAVAIDAGFRARAWTFVRDEPGAALALAAKKFAWTFTYRELPNAADIQWQTSQSWLFVPPVFPIGFGLVFPLALVGAVLVGRAWRTRLALAAPVACVVVACTLLFTNARFRLPMVPSLIVLAALAIEPGWAALREWRSRRKAAGMTVAAVIVGCVLTFANFWDVAHYRIAQIDVNTGGLEHAAGHLDAAARYLRAGLRRDPEDPGGWMELAHVLDESGRAEEAREALEQARVRSR